MISNVVANVGIDLSRHALNLSKILCRQLISKQDETREAAEKVVQSMATQCSDAGAIEEVVKHLFGVLKGNKVLSIYFY